MKINIKHTFARNRGPLPSGANADSRKVLQERIVFIYTRVMYICICQAVRAAEVRAAVEDGCVTLDALADELGVGAFCGGCRERAQTLIDEQAPQAIIVRQAAAA